MADKINPTAGDEPELVKRPVFADKPVSSSVSPGKSPISSPLNNSSAMPSPDPLGTNAPQPPVSRTKPVKKSVPSSDNPGGGSVKLEKPHKRFLLTLGGVALSLLILFSLANYVIPRVLVSFTRATRTGDYSPANSYVFASPITAKADGQQKIQVNVFLLDKEGHGVAEQPLGVNVRPIAGAVGTPQVRQVQPTTNKNGQAVFELTSTFAGQFEITANAGGADLPQKVSVVFK